MYSYDKLKTATKFVAVSFSDKAGSVSLSVLERGEFSISSTSFSAEVKDEETKTSARFSFPIESVGAVVRSGKLGTAPMLPISGFYGTTFQPVFGEEESDLTNARYEAVKSIRLEITKHKETTAKIESNLKKVEGVLNELTDWWD